MIVQSLAIIAVISVMAAMYLRSGKAQLAGLALPLLCLPLSYLLGVVVWGAHRDGDGLLTYRFAALAAGLLIGMAGYVLLSKKMPVRRGRIAYISLCGVFSLMLAFAYLRFLL